MVCFDVYSVTCNLSMGFLYLSHLWEKWFYLNLKKTFAFKIQIW